MNNNVFETIEGKEKIVLTDLQREGNIFVKKMSKARATKAVVNKEYFAPIYRLLTASECFDGCKLGAVEIEFNNRIKKYYFVK